MYVVLKSVKSALIDYIVLDML